ncbi:hypothetical protein [Amycolatopsis jejuensis]|uniref:hypothetical protein n=1 Tax=Amycolatopsis jejuensis TaxID=330084 RepID=UPI000524BEA3|nr:hypothetical protein [Amycolatopsis jejuensis]
MVADPARERQDVFLDVGALAEPEDRLRVEPVRVPRAVRPSIDHRSRIIVVVTASSLSGRFSVIELGDQCV